MAGIVIKVYCIKCNARNARAKLMTCLLNLVISKVEAAVAVVGAVRYSMYGNIYYT